MRIRAATTKDRCAIRKLIAAFPRQLVQGHFPAMSKFLLLKKKMNLVGCCVIEIYSHKIAEMKPVRAWTGVSTICPSSMCMKLLLGAVRPSFTRGGC